VIETAVLDASLSTTIAFWIRVVAFGLIQSARLTRRRLSVSSAPMPGLGQHGEYARAMRREYMLRLLWR
jgi:hypothetical protein